MSGIQQMLLAGSMVRITHTSESISDTAVAPAGATYQLTSGGVVNYSTVNSGSGSFADFCAPLSAAAKLEVKVDVAGSAVSGSATGSYLALTSTRTWTLAQVGVGVLDSTLTVTIREVANTANSLARTITLHVEGL